MTSNHDGKYLLEVCKRDVERFALDSKIFTQFVNQEEAIMVEIFFTWNKT